MFPDKLPTLSIKSVYFILAVLLIWGGFLRYYDLGHQSLWIDESYSALASEKIADTGSPLLDSGRYYGRSKPHTYLGALLIRLNGKSAFSLRLPSAVFGTAMILLAALTCRVFYGQWLPGLIAAMLIAFNHYEIAWSRQIRMYMEFQFFFALSTLLFYLYITRAKHSLLLLCTALSSTVLTVMLHMSGILILVPVGIMCILYNSNLTQKRVWVLGFCALCAIILAMLLYSHSQHTKFIQNFSFAQRANILATFIHLGHYSVFLYTNYPLIIAAAFVSFLYSFFHFNKEDVLLITTFCVVLFCASLQSSLIMRSLFFAMPLLFYPAAHGILLFGEHTTRLVKRLVPVVSCIQPPASTTEIKQVSNIGAGLSILIAIVCIIISEQNVLFPKKVYFLEHDPSYTDLNTWDYTPQPDFNAAYSYIRKYQNEDDIFVVAHSALHHWYMPNSETYWLGFLFLDDPKRTSFYHKNDQGDKVEGYLGLPAIKTMDDMKKIFADHHGFVVIDYYAMSTRTPPGYVKYLLEQAPVEFHNQAHPDLPWTRVWVGRF